MLKITITRPGSSSKTLSKEELQEDRLYTSTENYLSDRLYFKIGPILISVFNNGEFTNVTRSTGKEFVEAPTGTSFTVTA